MKERDSRTDSSSTPDTDERPSRIPRGACRIWDNRPQPEADQRQCVRRLGGQAAWKTIPSWYVVAQEDRAINPELERFYAKRMGATTSEIKASHVLFISQPEEIARVIAQAANAPLKMSAR
jgi:pimeloyl-ACP methyl ester carboxylesterase